MDTLSLISPRFAHFIQNDDGAVTVDWVVLTAAIIMLGMAAGLTVTSSVPGVANKISAAVAETPIGGS